MSKPKSENESPTEGPYTAKSVRRTTFKFSPIEFTSETVSETTASHPPSHCNCHDHDETDWRAVIDQVISRFGGMGASGPGPTVASDPSE